MTLENWKHIVNSPKNPILEEAKKFKTYADWRNWVLGNKSTNLSDYVKSNNTTTSQTKELFKYRKCRTCENLIEKNLVDIGNRKYLCKDCRNKLYKKRYKKRKSDGTHKYMSPEYIRKQKVNSLNEFKKTNEFKDLVSFVKKWGSLKTSGEMITEFSESYPDIRTYILNLGVAHIKKKYKIRKLSKWETMSTEEKREFYRKQRADYTKKNPENAKRLNRKSQKKRRLNPINKVSGNLRTRINKILKEKKFPKTKHLKEILGCDWETLEVWLSADFVGNMSMDNYGIEWTIQHIVPLTHCENTEEVNLLNFYKNLKPMTLEDNLSLNDNLLWGDLNEWHFKNEMVGNIIDIIVEKDKVLHYRNKIDRYFTKSDIKPIQKTFPDSDWRAYQNTKTIVTNKAKEILLKEVFTPTVLENLKNQLEVEKHS